MKSFCLRVYYDKGFPNMTPNPEAADRAYTDYCKSIVTPHYTSRAKFMAGWEAAHRHLASQPAAVEQKDLPFDDLQRFVNEAVCPVADKCSQGFVTGAYWGWGEARIQVGKLLDKARGGWIKAEAGGGT